VNTSVSDEWAALDQHFRREVRVLSRFRNASMFSVRRMWKRQTNEDGKHLSQFERDALKERHCELFGMVRLRLLPRARRQPSSLFVGSLTVLT